MIQWTLRSKDGSKPRWGEIQAVDVGIKSDRQATSVCNSALTANQYKTHNPDHGSPTS